MDSSGAPWRILDEAASPTSEGDAGRDSPIGRSGWLTPRLVAGLGLAAVLAVGAFALAITGPVGSVQVDGGTSLASDGVGPSGEIAPAGGGPVVDVQGAVLRPGLQRLQSGARVADAIAAAGGYGPRVDAARAASELNLAAAVNDGDRIVVPARGDPQAEPSGGPGAGAGSGGSAGGGLVDLNTATASELDELPGIGPKTAQKIIDARAEKPFASVDELRDRKIVGAATFEKLSTLVTVR
jgi:competence protein ComEA